MECGICGSTVIGLCDIGRTGEREKYMEMKQKVKLGKVMGTFFAVFLLLQIILLVMYEVFSIDVAKRNEKNLAENTLEIYSNTLEGVLNRLDDNLDDILRYQLQLNLLGGNSELEKIKAQYKLLQVLAEKCEDTKEADAYAIVNCLDNSILIQRNGNLPYERIEDVKNYLRKRNAFDQDVTSDWSAVKIQDQVYLVKYYNYGKDSIAVFLSEKKLASLLNYNDASIEGVEFYLTDTKENVICASGKQWKYGENIQKYQEKDSRYNFYRLGVKDTYQMYYSVKSSIYVSYSTLGITILAFLLLSVIFFIVIARYLQKEILIPINDLSWVSKKIQNGDFSARSEYSSNSYEMEEVKNTYNNMVQTILKMRMEKYEHELEMKDVQLKYMHMQLKPHYFLNALSTINSMVYQKEEENVHAFIQAFSQNIRYMFRTGLHTVPLADEAKNAQDYLEMQRLMYQDCFYVYMNIPEELEQYPVPQLILHTFLENVFKHVISIDSFTTVLIQALMENTSQEEQLKIEIHTSQKHFPEEIIAYVNEGETKRNGETGIGIRNVKEVLQLMYKKEHLIRLENLEPDGTLITIFIPKIPEYTDDKRG